MSNNPLYPLVGRYIYSQKTGERVFITPQINEDIHALYLWHAFGFFGNARNCQSITEMYTPSVRALAKRLGVQSADDLNDCIFI